ncbi:MAG: CHASE2 domain-containing protein, partial [Cyanobacteria bacterium P01_D01_bin.116]
IGNVVFHQIKSRGGGYQDIDANGEQVLLNYRAGNDIAQKLTLKQLFESAENNPTALEKFIKDKIILIGTIRSGAEDRWQTPYGRLLQQQMPGVEVQAHMVSQILSSVLNKRPLLTVLSLWKDTVWIWSWSLAGGLLLYCFQLSGKQLLPQIILAILISYGLIYTVCFYILIQGVWIAFIPSVIAFVGTASITNFVIRF